MKGICYQTVRDGAIVPVDSERNATLIGMKKPLDTCIVFSKWRLSLLCLVGKQRESLSGSDYNGFIFTYYPNP